MKINKAVLIDRISSCADIHFIEVLSKVSVENRDRLIDPDETSIDNSEAIEILFDFIKNYRRI